jgi:hypothetical protein
MALVQRKDIFKDYSAHLVQVDRSRISMSQGSR